MSKRIRRGTGIIVAAFALAAAATGTAVAAGPQELPPAACNSGTATASGHAPTRISAEAIPHVEHSYPIAVPYCHHFNPTASAPVAG
jgi:hypothetical protein